MRPLTIPTSISRHYVSNQVLTERIDEIKWGFTNLLYDMPEVSIVMPAYNEEENILKTLSSLASSKTKRSVEVIVVNNNSTDKTEELALKAGVICIKETRQGITNARNAGLARARGKFIVNADADTIYPPDWVEEMVKPLASNNAIALTYGKFSFIPVGKTGRNVYFFYEYLADFSRLINKNFKDEAVNVYGFVSAFRREQGISVEGFNHPPGTNEDGWMALKLRNKDF